VNARHVIDPCEIAGEDIRSTAGRCRREVLAAMLSWKVDGNRNLSREAEGSAEMIGGNVAILSACYSFHS
jgi:hypothetical protein